MDLRIFVEGDADVKFIVDFVYYHFNVSLSPNSDIIKTEGCDKIFSSKDGENTRIAMEKNSDNGGKNILIFDADNNYDDKMKKLIDWKKLHNLEFDIFLFPNNQDNGDLESLLENIIAPKNQPIFDCWSQYEKCLNSKRIEGRTTPLTTPAKKTKIYGYLEALLGDTKSQKEKIKEKNRDYTKDDHWNLNSDYLSPLRIFLESYFK